MSIELRCDMAVDGVHETCCYHDFPADSKDAPGSICCHCGSYYLPLPERNHHGPYEPRISATERKRRHKVADEEQAEQHATEVRP